MPKLDVDLAQLACHEQTGGAVNGAKGVCTGVPVCWRVNGTWERHHLELQHDCARQDAPARREDVDLLKVSLLARDAQKVESG